MNANISSFILVTDLEFAEDVVIPKKAFWTIHPIRDRTVFGAMATGLKTLKLKAARNYTRPNMLYAPQRAN